MLTVDFNVVHINCKYNNYIEINRNFTIFLIFITIELLSKKFSKKIPNVEIEKKI